MGDEDFTIVSKRGKSVVNYIASPQQTLNQITNFKVEAVSDVIAKL